MLQQERATKTQSDRDIVITRIFNAPRELVWNVWTDLKHVEHWWGPRGFTTRAIELDLRPGGQWRFVMIGPDGTEYPIKGVFREVVPLQRIVATDEFDAGFEQVVNADLPQGIVTTTGFEEWQGKTKLTLQITHTSANDRRKHEEMGVIAGWNSSFDCLDEFLEKQTEQQQQRMIVTLPSDREIIVTRVFHAPRQLVFAAWTQPEHVKRWFGGYSSMIMTVCEINFRVGGSWRYVLHDPRTKTNFVLAGEYREIVPPKRLVATERYESIPKSDHLNTLTLTEQNGKTTLHLCIQHQSKEQRNEHLQSGIEMGWRETMNRLEELLQHMA